MRPPAMLATSALHLSGHRRRRRRQIACCQGNSLGLGRGDNHLLPNQGCTGGGGGGGGWWSICSHLNEVTRSSV